MRYSELLASQDFSLRMKTGGHYLDHKDVTFDTLQPVKSVDTQYL
jgi:hypothetical protein